MAAKFTLFSLCSIILIAICAILWEISKSGLDYNTDLDLARYPPHIGEWARQVLVLKLHNCSYLFRADFSTYLDTVSMCNSVFLSALHVTFTK